MMQQRQPSQEATEADVEPLTSRKKKNKNNKRRFSDEQVTSLETIFASETKLEPKKKVQVARELGLQPRQVAIWFQNKRARWKSKQLEKNYRILKTSYDNLKARFDSMRKEKESLLDQLQELHGLLEKSHKGSSAGCKDSVANSQYMIKLDNKDEVAELPVKSSSLHLQEEMDQQGMLYSDDDKSGNMAYLGQDEPDQLMNISENIEGTSTISLVKWCSFDAGNLFDQSSTSSHWWDTWA